MERIVRSKKKIPFDTAENILDGEQADNTQEKSKLLSVSSENANYYLHPGDHYKETQISDNFLEKMDGIVLEYAKEGYEQVSLEEFTNSIQYESIIEKNLDLEESPLFCVDTPYKDIEEDVNNYFKRNTASSAIGTAGIALGRPEFALLMLPISSKLLAHKFPEKALNSASYAQLSDAGSSVGLRSALAADKLEKFVSPKLVEDKGQKPNILVDYGSGHLDIGAYIQHSNIRDKVLKLHQKNDFGPLQEEYVNEVCEFNFQDIENWNSNELEGTRYKKIVYELDGYLE